MLNIFSCWEACIGLLQGNKAGKMLLVIDVHGTGASRFLLVAENFESFETRDDPITTVGDCGRL